MVLKRWQIALVLFAMLSMSEFSAAALGEILDDNIAAGADAFVLEEEAKLFDTIRKGIALSIAQCEGIELCVPAVNKDELERIISTLDTRISSLSQRYEESGEAELESILISYADSRDSYTKFLDKLATIVPAEEEAGDIFADEDFLGGEDEGGEAAGYDDLFRDADQGIDDPID